jgi:serine O-acetyltransferase
MPATCVCEGASFRDAMRQDIDRYVAAAERDGLSGTLARLRVPLSLKVWAVGNYRLSHWFLNRVRPRALGRVLGGLSFIGQRMLSAVTGLEINPHAHLGPGLMIPHDGFIVIGPVRVGRHCTLSHNVTIGQGLQGDGPAHDDTPVLGDRVWVGPGAVIAGPIKVGSDASVGANSVLLRDVPPRGVVLGVPARLLSHKGSFTQIYYRGMKDDPDRRLALEAPVPGSEGAAGAS